MVFYRSTIPTTGISFLVGDLRDSDDGDCTSDADDSTLSGWLVELDGPGNYHSFFGN